MCVNPIILSENYNPEKTKEDFNHSLFVFQRKLTIAWLAQRKDQDKLNNTSTAFSTTSIAFALGMYCHLMANNTRKNAIKKMGFEGFSVQDLQFYLKKMVEDIQYRKDKIHQVSIVANGYFIDPKANKGISDQLTDLQKPLKDIYDAKFKECPKEDMPKEINAFVEGKTQRMIKNLIPKNAELDVAVVTTHFFSSPWDKEFPQNKNKIDNFYYGINNSRKAKVLYMSTKKTPFFAYEDKNIFMVKKQFSGKDKFFFNIFMNKSISHGVEQIEKLLTYKFLKKANNEIGYYNNIELTLPQFKVTGKTQNLKGLFKLMGVNLNIFGAHETKIDVDRKGVKAASATAVMATRGSGFTENKIYFNRPFIGMITREIKHNKSIIPLSYFRCTEPSIFLDREEK